VNSVTRDVAGGGNDGLGGVGGGGFGQWVLTVWDTGL
jgi:hypothetical protein